MRRSEGILQLSVLSFHLVVLGFELKVSDLVSSTSVSCPAFHWPSRFLLVGSSLPHSRSVLVSVMDWPCCASPKLSNARGQRKCIRESNGRLQNEIGSRTDFPFSEVDAGKSKGGRSSTAPGMGGRGARPCSVYLTPVLCSRLSLIP